MVAQKKSFVEIYSQVKKWPPQTTPRKEFISRIASLTKRSEFTVRMWCTGHQSPDALAQSVISKELNIPADVLFPEGAPQFGKRKKDI